MTGQDDSFALRWSLRSLALLGASLVGVLSFAEEKASAGKDETHWAFVPPKRPPLPEVEHRGWARNPIDAFILARLEEEGLEPSPEADRATLLRRLAFDLTGLPPDVEDLKRFLTDRSADAYEKAVDRMLASPRYGERWAQHWLDLARYADTDGFEFDQARDDAWRYRDWVVAALNRDLPYDAFMRLQLAGDEAAPDDPSAFIATGFNRCYPDMVDLNDQGLRRQNALNDITETTGLAFLGLTIGCARCHDHKTDPIRQVDFYRLQSFFGPARFRDDYPVASRAERIEHEQGLERWLRETADLQKSLIGLESQVRRIFAAGVPRGLNDDVVAAFQKPENERNAHDVAMVFDALRHDRRIRPRAWTLAFDPTTARIRQLLLAEVDRRQKSPPARLPIARGIDEDGAKPSPTYLLKRGDFNMKGPEVTPGFPPAIEPGPEPTIPTFPKSSGRRSTLADWLAKPDHPLTSRVLVNRLWQHHFGRGLVATPSDFGIMGAEPSHPELLDWLASEFVERGWSLKAMHRLLVTSATYRQSSRPQAKGLAVDPEGQQLWRYRRQRLDGEAIRDSLLAASGQLQAGMGGPPVFPKLPAELTKLSSKGAVWPVSADEHQRDRRSLYVFVRRNLRYPFFEAFDRPDTNASCPQRAVTTIAPQALSLLNSEFASESAQGMAARLEHAFPHDIEARLRLAYLLAFSREPDAFELELGRAFLAQDPSWSHLCLALLNTNEFIYID
ncbi:DUF1549 and DUF1553 domain-containing protein [Singulisphaera sp. PoT]|uniref:DUF1549 and DUF1553 domain-containing protein n=1 Tax=Singulisphaera sp. PoT TaxID=3411797 RepID=UPI003BF51A93